MGVEKATYLWQYGTLFFANIHKINKNPQLKYKYNEIIVNQEKLKCVAIDNHIFVSGYTTIRCNHNNQSGKEAWFFSGKQSHRVPGNYNVLSPIYQTMLRATYIKCPCLSCVVFVLSLSMSEFCFAQGWVLVTYFCITRVFGQFLCPNF